MAIIRYMSLDMFTHFFKYIGIESENLAAFQRIFKKLIIYIYEPRPVSLRQGGNIAASSLVWLENNLESIDYKSFIEWLNYRYIYNYSDNPQTSVWLKFFQYSKTREYLLRCPQGKEMLEAYKQSILKDEIKELYSRESRKMLSLWDTEMFALGKLCFDEKNDPLLNFIVEAAEVNSLIELSMLFDKTLSRESINCLNVTAKQLRIEENMRLPEPFIEFQNLYRYGY